MIRTAAKADGSSSAPIAGLEGMKSYSRRIGLVVWSLGEKITTRAQFSSFAATLDGPVVHR